jgi:CheY-like chemotaxis protein
MLIPNNYARNKKKLRFLTVEDDLASQELMELMLSSKFNCEVYCADTGEQALVITTNKLFDLIIINVGLPGIDGIAAAKIIRVRGKNKHTPIIITSGTFYEESLYIEAGINAFLVKPFAILELEKAIKKLIPL